MTIDKTQPVELVMTTDFQHKPFTITGDYDAVAPLAAELKQYVAPKVAQTAIEAVQAAPNPVKQYLGALASNVATEARVSVYDAINGTRLRQALHEKRQDERNLRMAQKLGLIGATHCARHERQLASIRSIR